MLGATPLDSVVMVHTYHEIKQHQEVLAKVRAALKPGGRLVLLDLSPHGDPQSDRSTQFDAHKLALGLAKKDLTDAGFRILRGADPWVTGPDGDPTWLLAAERP